MKDIFSNDKVIFAFKMNALVVIVNYDKRRKIIIQLLRSSCIQITFIMWKILYTIILLSAFLSCSKDVGVSKPAILQISDSSYMPHKPGTFWIYDYVEADSLYHIFNHITQDTVKITKDTIIGSHTYFEILGDFTFPCSQCKSYWRDSLGYMVDEKGEIFFSKSNFTDTFNYYSDSSIISFNKMMHKDSMVWAYYGFYKTYNYARKVYYSNPLYPNLNLRIGGNFFAKGVGIIKAMSWHDTSATIFGGRLVNYYIQK